MWVRLDAAQRWVRVIATLLLLAGLIVLGAGVMMFFRLEAVPQVAQMAAALGTFLACVLLIPSVILFRYALRLRHATKTKAISHLLIAFRTQERFWAYASGLLILYIALCVISAILRSLHPELGGGLG